MEKRSFAKFDLMADTVYYNMPGHCGQLRHIPAPCKIGALQMPQKRQGSQGHWPAPTNLCTKMHLGMQMSYQMTNKSTVYSIACSDKQQRKHKSSVLQAHYEGNPPVTGGFTS